MISGKWIYFIKLKSEKVLNFVVRFSDHNWSTRLEHFSDQTPCPAIGAAASHRAMQRSEPELLTSQVLVMSKVLTTQVPWRSADSLCHRARA